MYIIETHCSLNSDGTIADHESRIIKIPNWEEYVRLFHQYDGKKCGYYPATKHGYVLGDDLSILMCESNKVSLRAYIERWCQDHYESYIVMASVLEEIDPS